MEGYVDVIAMVEAGFERGGGATRHRAHRGPARPALAHGGRADPLFDGDKAGRRAAFRAIDIALPHLKPGKSLTFGALPEGQDPDDLIRASGREAMDAVLERTEPLATCSGRGRPRAPISTRRSAGRHWKRG